MTTCFSSNPSPESSYEDSALDKIFHNRFSWLSQCLIIFCSHLQMSLSLCYEEAEVSPPPFLVILLGWEKIKAHVTELLIRQLKYKNKLIKARHDLFTKQVLSTAKGEEKPLKSSLIIH